jgi:hypothetical protein
MSTKRQPRARYDQKDFKLEIPSVDKATKPRAVLQSPPTTKEAIAGLWQAVDRELSFLHPYFGRQPKHK